MKSTCIDQRRAGQHGGRAIRRSAGPAIAARPGTAEIETMLAIIVILLPILFVVAFAGKLGLARLSNVYSAENGAYTQVETGAEYSASADPVPVDAPVMPLLPNRFAVAAPQQGVQQDIGRQATPMNVVNLQDKAWFLDTAWYYGPGPVPTDQQTLHAWFTDYVGQSHSAALDNALGIQPPGPP